MSDPITPAALERLEALREASGLAPLESTHIISPGYEHFANLTEAQPRMRALAMLPKEWADAIAETWNAAPALFRALREAWEQNAQLQAALKVERYDALAKAEYTAECEQTLAEARAENARLTAALAAAREDARAALAEEVLQEIWGAEPESDIRGVNYVSVQIDRDIWERVQALARKEGN